MSGKFEEPEIESNIGRPITSKCRKNTRIRRKIQRCSQDPSSDHINLAEKQKRIFWAEAKKKRHESEQCVRKSSRRFQKAIGNFAKQTNFQKRLNYIRWVYTNNKMRCRRTSDNNVSKTIQSITFYEQINTWVKSTPVIFDTIAGTLVTMSISSPVSLAAPISPLPVDTIPQNEIEERLGNKNHITIMTSASACAAKIICCRSASAKVSALNFSASAGRLIVASNSFCLRSSLLASASPIRASRLTSALPETTSASFGPQHGDNETKAVLILNQTPKYEQGLNKLDEACGETFIRLQHKMRKMEKASNENSSQIQKFTHFLGFCPQIQLKMENIPSINFQENLNDVRTKFESQLNFSPKVTEKIIDFESEDEYEQAPQPVKKEHKTSRIPSPCPSLSQR
uniref:Uncharacterized protein n=1 Tax=Romanomermis culicivorax TaxID=13658 RepID=A0A915KRE3_ROMCU